MEILNFTIPEREKESILLPFGGSDKEGNCYTVDNISLMKNEERLLPVMGEFHYARWEPEGWREEIQKMKAGGVQILATYVFWIHHEEKQGEWDFSGCRNLRLFLQTCREEGMKVWLRIGPWCHGECRHGGFPDWVQWSKSFTPRTNDPGYLDAVEKLFAKLAGQCEGMMCKDGGPVIGIQLENEYGHCGGPDDEKERYDHMKELLRLAKKAGFQTPYYTATGWGGGGMIEETLPVLGGYVDAPWHTNTKQMAASKNFLFTAYRNDETIGSDWNQGGAKENKTDSYHYPFLTCELGGGLQVTSHRRPYCTAKDTEANALCLLGGGANLLGYYMYHGGINPDGKYTSLQETQTIGGYTTVPEKSYDFEGILNEAGKPNESYGAVKKQNLLVGDFGSDIAGGQFLLPDQKPEGPEDMTRIRAALRFNRKTGNGWLFINNHQRLRSMQEHENVCFRICDKEKEIAEIKQVSVLPDQCSILPVHFQWEGCLLKSTNASLLCHVGKRLFFYSLNPDQVYFDWEKDAPDVTLLTEEEANRAFKEEDGLYLTSFPDSCIIRDQGKLCLITPHEKEVITIIREDGSREEREIQSVRGESAVSLALIREKGNNTGVEFREYRIQVDYQKSQDRNNQFLQIDYRGDRAEIYRNGKLIDDWYTTGAVWNVSLKRFSYPKELTVRIYDSNHLIPCTWGNDVYYDLPVEKGCQIDRIRVTDEYRREL